MYNDGGNVEDQHCENIMDSNIKASTTVLQDGQSGDGNMLLGESH